jgi:Tfp pilus assembly protein PilW
MSTPVDTARRRFADDRGITLVELLVTAAITAVLGVIAATVTIATLGTQQKRMDSSNRTAEGKVATELLTRDLRDARLIPSWTPKQDVTTSSITLWDDRNLDYRQQPAEMVGWALDPARRLCRTTSASDTRCLTGGNDASVTFKFTYVASDLTVPPERRKYSSVTVTLQAGRDSPMRRWTVTLENLRSGEP